MSSVSNTGWSRWDALMVMSLVCWAIGFWWHLVRPPSMWILDLAIIPFTAVVYVFAFVMSILAVVASRRLVVLLTVAPVIVVLTALVNPMWRVAPRTWFMVHRPLFDLALETDPGTDYYGNELPAPLRFLTADGRVSNDNGNIFFAQWLGIPDDAGGYIYNPGQSPEGADLYGLFCQDPVDLGGGWWMCGLADNGF